MLRTMMLAVAVSASVAYAQLPNPFEAAKSLAGDAAKKELEKKVNAKLLAEGRKNQCTFKTDSDALAPGCDAKLKNLAKVLIEAKKQLDGGGVQSYKFEVSGHTDSSGAAEHNKELSGKRAATIVKELGARGVPENQIISVGPGQRAPAGEAGRHRGQEGEEPALRDSGPAVGSARQTSRGMLRILQQTPGLAPLRLEPWRKSRSVQNPQHAQRFRGPPRRCAQGSRGSPAALRRRCPPRWR